MRDFCARTLRRIARFFWSWGFLKFVLFAATLVVLLYAEEDWRGARAWARTKAYWEAKGETFDYNKFIPPPAPDNENLAALPLFKLEPVQYYPGKFDPQQLALKRAMRMEQPDDPTGNLPSKGNWMAGELPNWEKIRTTIATDYTTAFPGTKPPADTLAQFDALYPFIADLRAGSASRPLFRPNLDYSILPPCSRSLGSVTNSIRLSQILTLHALIELDHHEPELALSDIKIDYKLVPGAAREPSLVGGLVAVGINAITLAAVHDGLAFHEWNDAQLVELEQTLQRVDFLADYQFDLRSTAMESSLNIEGFKHAPANQIFGMTWGMSDSSEVVKESNYSFLWGPFYRAPAFWPAGWWDANQPQQASFILRRLSTVNSLAHRVYPDVDRDLTKQIDQARARWDAAAPWDFWYYISSTNLNSMAESFAHGQTWVDEARIACGLERYRLAHGMYPDALDALAPACIEAVPHDIITGQAYHYRLNADGTYLLYSVGWNQADDGGKFAFKKDNPNAIDYEQGDWVWPGPR